MQTWEYLILRISRGSKTFSDSYSDGNYSVYSVYSGATKYIEYTEPVDTVLSVNGRREEQWVRNPDDAPELIPYLEHLGAEGWELVAIDHHAQWVFKRPKS